MNFIGFVILKGGVRSWGNSIGETTVSLPLGGVASSDLEEVRASLIRPFWLLAAASAVAVALFVWLRLAIQ